MSLTATAVGAAAFLAWVDALPPPDHRPEITLAYRYQADIYQQIAEAIEASPRPIEVERLGTSAGDRPIWAFHLRPPSGKETDRALVIGGIHALEWLSTEVATETLLWAAATPPEGVALTVIPLLNPDGRAKVEADLSAAVNRYRRGNQANVDLNRDFSVNREARGPWQRVIPGYYHTSPGPLSQPESRALDALLARERYQRAVSLHAFGRYIYYPWSGRFARPEDWRALDALALEMSAAQDRPYNATQLGRWAFFFRALGSEIDHMYGHYGVQAFLIELGPSGLRPWRPSTFRDYFSWYNPVDPRRHVRAGLQATKAMIRHRDATTSR
ncbi:MAG: hypothetical protein JXX28_17735 [Deltaproteobacteria bacterium]|nr:hypothetical protein [Deltaproteobacteria bacterium]